MDFFGDHDYRDPERVFDGAGIFFAGRVRERWWWNEPIRAALARICQRPESRLYRNGLTGGRRASRGADVSQLPWADARIMIVTWALNSSLR